MDMESNNISQSRRKGPIIWQSRFTLVLLQVAFYIKARLCRSQRKSSLFRLALDDTICLADSFQF